jgi:hypothetical protein
MARQVPRHTLFNLLLSYYTLRALINAAPFSAVLPFFKHYPEMSSFECIIPMVRLQAFSKFYLTYTGHSSHSQWLQEGHHKHTKQQQNPLHILLLPTLQIAELKILTFPPTKIIVKSRLAQMLEHTPALQQSGQDSADAASSCVFCC